MRKSAVDRNVSIKNQVLLALRRSPRLKRFLKAAFDYAIALPALLLLSPLMLAIALFIKLESPGPIFWRRRVLGLNGREFTAYQFRTIYIDSDDRLIRNRQQWVAILRGAKAADPRVTRVGRFLRQTGLDVLPRLFNILFRDMSLVGPHAVTRQDIMRYGRKRVELLTSVTPGLTGIWQLNALKKSPSERLTLEMEYINNWTPWLDFKILLNTLTIVLQQQPI